MTSNTFTICSAVALEVIIIIFLTHCHQYHHYPDQNNHHCHLHSGFIRGRGGYDDFDDLMIFDYFDDDICMMTYELCISGFSGDRGGRGRGEYRGRGRGGMDGGASLSQIQIQMLMQIQIQIKIQEQMDMGVACS